MTTDKPNFEKEAEESYNGLIQDNEDPDYKLGYCLGSLNIWQDFVLLRDEKIKELEKENARLKEVEDCNKRTILSNNQERGELQSKNQRLLSALKRIKDECNRPEDEPCNITYIEMQCDLFKTELDQQKL